MEIVIIVVAAGLVLRRLTPRRHGGFVDQPCRWCADDIRHTRKGWVHKKTGKEYGPFVGSTTTMHPALPNRDAFWVNPS